MPRLLDLVTGSFFRSSSEPLGPMGMAFSWRGLFFTDYPPSWEKIPPVEDPGLCDPLGEPGWLSW